MFFLIFEVAIFKYNFVGLKVYLHAMFFFFLILLQVSVST